MIEQALLLSAGDLSAAEQNIGRVLDFFGIVWSVRPISYLLRATDCGDEDVPKRRIFCSSETFLELTANLERSREVATRWRECIHSVFIYFSNNDEVSAKLIKVFAGEQAVMREASSGARNFLVADDPEQCGVMAGIHIKNAAPPATFFAGALGHGIKKIVSVEEDALCVSVRYHEVPLFLSSSSEVVDPKAELMRGIFDIREHAASALPVVLYIKWAFPRTCWRSAEISGSLIIDDPLLKPSHGFVDFTDLLSLMKRHHFSTNIAFIPWNWRRSNSEVVKLFLDHPQFYSISVHGCDHTRAEFGSGNVRELQSTVQCALARMSAHEEHTGIRHDRVMVFPQGVFSSAAMTVLKRTELIAAVNNDTISADSPPLPVTIADVWDVAVMKYADFPLFTRRYPWEGLENFAFDALLGKPVVIVIHHESCRDRCQRLLEFIDALNTSRIAPIWRNLGEVVRRSYRQRSLADNLVEIEMYATELRLENHFRDPKIFRVRRREVNPSSIKEVRIGGQPTVWDYLDGGISLTVRLNPGENTDVQVIFEEFDERTEMSQRASTTARVMLIRYLCEVRDNYVTKAKLVCASALGRKDQEWN